MSPDRSPSNIVCAAMPLGWQTGIDMTASLDLIEEATIIKRSWNGRARSFADPAFQLYKVTLTSGEGELKAPPFTRLMPGTEFEIVIEMDFEDFIATGGIVRTLIRDPYPGSIRVKNLGWDNIPFSIDGRVLTLATPAVTPVRISYRPVLQVMVTEAPKPTESASTKKVTWSLGLEEQGSDD